MSRCCWTEGVKRWFRRWHISNVEHRGPGRFGEQAYWEGRYRSEASGPTEWFLSAEKTAKSAALAYGRHSGAVKRPRVLHVGCGLSQVGSEIAKIIDCDDVLNVDCSLAALRKLEEAVPWQRYRLWDAATDPAFESFDLILDKGTLDALQFAGSDPVVNYVGALRHWLQSGGLYCHWSDDAPEMKMDLLRSAFPDTDGFHVTFTTEDDDDDDTTTSFFHQWTYYRYLICRE